MRPTTHIGSLGSQEKVLDLSAFVSIAGWAIGIAAVMLACFQYAGSGEPVEREVLPPLVPPTVRYFPTATDSPAGTMTAVIERSRRIAESQARSKVTAVQDDAATFSDSKHQCLVGKVVNDSELTVRKWMATIRYYDADGKVLFRKTTWSTTAIPPGTSNGYRIRLPLVPNAARASFLLHGIDFLD